MPSEEKFNTIREAVGVFDNPETLQEAIDELMSSDFDRAELSLLASEQTVDEKLGHHYEKVKELEDDPMIPRTAYVSTESIGDMGRRRRERKLAKRPHQIICETRVSSNIVGKTTRI
jgi:hypothetical protein